MNKFMKKVKEKTDIYFGTVPKTAAFTIDRSIAYYDWSPECNANNQWFTEFIQHNLPNEAYKLNFYGVFGKGRFVRNKLDGGKIFFSGENLDKKFTKWNWNFGDYCLDYVDLAMGFGDIKNDKYLRFPLWILYVFSPKADKSEIIDTVNRINNTRYPKTRGCALIAGHDKHGTRTMVCEGVKNILDVEFAGRWRNNTQDLWDKYKDDKIAYLTNFKFTICPENINTQLYVTEKIFEAFMADAIPIYYGSNNNPEPNIINKSATILWSPDGNNEANIKLIQDLKSNDKLYNDFIAQPKLLPYTAEYVQDKFSELKDRIAKIIKK